MGKRWAWLCAAAVAWCGALDAASPKSHASSPKPAAPKGSAKLYRWTDAQGQVHFTDTLPPEALRQARTEYEKGRAVRQVDRPLSPEEQAQRLALEQTQDAMRAAEESSSLVRQAYPTQLAIRQDFQQRRSVYEGRLVSDRAMELERRRALRQAVFRAADTELAGKHVSPNVQRGILAAWQALQQIQSRLADTQKSLDGLAEAEAALIGQWETAGALSNPAPSITP